mgnify:CR=1 FL=1
MADQPPSFSTYASRLLSSTFTTADQPQPLFFSTFSTRDSLFVAHEDDDILGQSDELGPFTSHADGRRLSLGDAGSDDDDGEREHEPAGGSASGSGAAESERSYPQSRLWERAPALPAFSMSRIPGLGTVSRGWKTHESVLPLVASDVYQEHDDSDSDADSDELSQSPPSFLSPAPLPPTDPPTERLLHPRTLFVYPSTPRAGARTTYQNPHWIAAYGLCVLAAAFVAVSMWWSSLGSVSTQLSPSRVIRAAS